MSTPQWSDVFDIDPDVTASSRQWIARRTAA